MTPAHLTALAKGVLLFAGLSLSAGPAAASSRDDGAHPLATTAEVSGAVVLDAAPSAPSVLTLGEWSQVSGAVALEAENIEVEGGDGRHEPTDADAVIAAPTSRRQPGASATLLVSRDAVASHAARGPPAR